MITYASRVAVVTGGASGIGEATAAALRASGATTVTLDVQPASQAEGEHVEVDLTDHAAVAAAITAVGEQHGKIDLLVNNAGIGSIGTVEHGELDEWRRVFEVNVLGLVGVSRAALPYLRQSTGRAIVNVSSLVAFVGIPDRAAYSASKGAVYALTLSMAADLLDDGIRVNAVAPGTTGTPWVKRLLGAAKDPVQELVRLEQRQPIGRLGTAEEIASVIVFLGSDLATFVNGAIWAVDGGMAGLRVPPRSPAAASTGSRG